MEAFIKLAELFFSYIIMRGIVAPLITKVFKKTVLRPLVKWFKRNYITNTRSAAIYLHQLNRSARRGHDDRNIFECEDGICTRF